MREEALNRTLTWLKSGGDLYIKEPQSIKSLILEVIIIEKFIIKQLICFADYNKSNSMQQCPISAHGL